MMPVSVKISAERRGILLHDGLAFLVLSLISIALYILTWFLFRSFEGHREDLGVRWAERGKASLAQGKPVDAIYSLRTALSYAPDDHEDQLLLAEALAQAGHIDEATNYYLNLWDQTPGDGFINLQLARLARTKGDTQQATNYYRAAIFGNWEGDGPSRRRDVRLELADFLIQHHELTAARAELFIAAANNPQDAGLALAVAARLNATGDLSDALAYDQKAIAIDPKNRVALIAAAHTAFTLGDFASARRLFERAAEAPSPPNQTADQHQDEQAGLEAYAQQAHRATELSLSRDLPQAERLDHLLAASTLAEDRLKACVTKVAAPPVPQAKPAELSTDHPAASKLLQTPAQTVPFPLTSLTARWTAALTPQARRLLAQNTDAQDARALLIYQTEADTVPLCGQPTGDDAILLMLSHLAAQQSAAQSQIARGR